MANFRSFRRRAHHQPVAPIIAHDDIETNPSLQLSPATSGGIVLGDVGSGVVRFNPLEFAMGLAGTPFQIDDRHAENADGEPVGRSEHLRLETMWETIAQATEAAAFEEFEMRIGETSETAAKLVRLVVISERDRLLAEKRQVHERTRDRHLRRVVGTRQPSPLFEVAREPWMKAGVFGPDTALAAVVLAGVFPNLSLALLGGASVALGTVAAGTLSGESARTSASRKELGPPPKNVPEGAAHLFSTDGGKHSWMLGVPLLQAGAVTALLGTLGVGAGEGAAKSFGAAGLLGLSALGSFAIAWLGHDPVIEALEASAGRVAQADEELRGHHRREMEAAGQVARLEALLEQQLSAAAAAFKAAVALGKAAIAHVGPNLTSYVDETVADLASPAHEFETKVTVPVLPDRPEPVPGPPAGDEALDEADELDDLDIDGSGEPDASERNEGGAAAAAA